MNTAPVLRRKLLAFAIVVSPLVVLACSQASSHPGVIGDCSGANCPPGQGQSGASGSSGGGTTDGSTSTDGSTGGDDSGSTTDGGGGGLDSGSGGD